MWWGQLLPPSFSAVVFNPFQKTLKIKSEMESRRIKWQFVIKKKNLTLIAVESYLEYIEEKLIATSSHMRVLSGFPVFSRATHLEPVGD